MTIHLCCKIKKKKKKKQLYDTRISNSGNGVTTRKSFLGLDDLSDASSIDESDDIHVNQTKPNVLQDRAEILATMEIQYRRVLKMQFEKNNRQSKDSDDEDDTPTTDLSESTNRLLESR